MKDYSKAPVRVQKKSGFDKSFQNLFTSKVGTITPILCDELIPNTTVDLTAAITAQLPPLASDTFMRCKLKYAAFFVPTRILVNGYESWLTDADYPYNAEPSSTEVQMPLLKLTRADAKAGSLSDYLGIKMHSDNITEITSGISMTVNALPFLGYHRIYDDWFRNSMLQPPVFYNLRSPSAQNYSAASSKVVSPSLATGSTTGTTNLIDASVLTSTGVTGSLFADGHSILDLRQANFDYDIFTSCSPKAQNGNAAKVTLGTVSTEGATTGANGSFTISALRAANSMQQFLERNNIAGNRMVDYVKAQYGANLNDSIAQRPILLGSGSFDVYSKGIYQTTPYNGVVSDTNNPFESVGAKYGSAMADGSDRLVNNFTAAEPGYLYVLAWLSPKRTYGTGVDPILTRYTKKNSQSDMANPILQNIGNEPIYQRQLDATSVGTDAVFGYNERYATWKDKTDEVHGLLRDGESLESFALQQSYTGGTSVQNLFLQIPTDYLDQVAATEGDISNYGYWCDTYFKYRVSMPLAQYSIPSLEDVAAEHGETIMIDKMGRTIS